MRILFFGTSSFAVPILQSLSKSTEYDILGVVTQPDRPRGRGRQPGVSPVKQLAIMIEAPIYQPENVKSPSFVNEVQQIAPDAFVLASYGQIIPRKLLNMPQYGPINVHASLLPAWRGAAPIQHSLLNGDRETGVTTMWMTPSLDCGDILLQRSLPIDRDDDSDTLTSKLADLGAILLLETLDRIKEGNCPRTPQDDSRATYAPSLRPSDAFMRWEQSAEVCRNRIRAMCSKPGAFASFAGRRVKIYRAEIAEETNLAPGTIISIGHGSVVVACSDRALELREVQPESGRRMSASDWARGMRIKTGEKFDLEPPPI
jgi:methionyl-tRNA formyltransferase